MKTLLTIVLIAICSAAIAQNYDCLQYGPRRFFSNGNHYVRGIRIDSTKTIGSDVIYYPYQTLRQSGYLLGSPIIDSISASWLGGTVVKKSDGTFLFDNLWDTVTIKTQAHTGESWVFFNDTFHVYYKATVASEDTMSILGTLDSVKKIIITAHTTGGAPYTIDPVNNFQLILSKNSGFVQAFDLYTFPYHYPDTLKFNPPTVYSIRQADLYLDAVLGNLGSCPTCSADNMPTIQNSVFKVIDLYNPSRFEIYNFAAGDVMEWHGTYFNPSGTISGNAYQLDTITTVTTTTSSRDIVSIRLTMNALLDVAFTPPHHDTTYSLSTPTLTVDSSKLINRFTMPEEAIDGYSHILHYYPHLPLAGLGCDSPASYSFMEIYGFDYNGVRIAPHFDSTVYSIGYGKTAHTLYVPYGAQQYEHYNYINKGSTPCGTFVTITPHTNAVPITPNPYKITCSPNPASDHIAITSQIPFTDNTTIIAYDITGRIINRINITGQKEVLINSSDWINGLYLLVIQSSDDMIMKIKVAIQK